MDSYKAIWNHVLDYIHASAEFSTATFSIWFKELELEGLTESYAYISAKEYYKSEFVFKMYYKQLQSAIFEILGARVELVLLSRDLHSETMQEIQSEHQKRGLLPPDAFCKESAGPAFAAEEDLSEEEKKQIREPVGTLIKTEIPGKEYTFENFIVGDTNRMAHDACLAIARNPAEIWNPLFLHSPSGMGKTHLLYAISNEIIKYNPQKQIQYVRGEDFSNELIDTLVQKKPMHYFRERYRNVDVLLVDDIQFIAGKESTQQEFFHTFDTLFQFHKQIIITSDRPPRDLKPLSDRLRNRFESGLTVDIQPPELELRIAIASSKAKALGLEIPDSVLLFIADNIKSSIRQLEGVIKSLHGYSQILGKKVDMDLAKQCLHDMVSEKSVDQMVEKTFDRVCEKYKVSVQDLTSRRRQANIVIARHVATYILRQLSEMSSVEIARYFSQDHTSILSAIKNVEKKIEDNPVFEEEVTRLMREIRE